MTTKPLLLAVMLALPITANAAYTYNVTNTPTAVASNGTVTKARSWGPYQTITPGEHDDKHIASTSYVIGAYNDAIAAINTLQAHKQIALTAPDLNNDPVDGDLISADYFVELLEDEENAEEVTSMRNSLLSAYGVAAGIHSQRVEVYTNWDDDDATTDVAFKTVIPE